MATEKAAHGKGRELAPVEGGIRPKFDQMGVCNVCGAATRNGKADKESLLSALTDERYRVLNDLTSRIDFGIRNLWTLLAAAADHTDPPEGADPNDTPLDFNMGDEGKGAADLYSLAKLAADIARDAHALRQQF